MQLAQRYIKNREALIFSAALMFLGGIGVLIILYATNWGVGYIDWDSFNYIAVARNLADGLGFVYPVDPDNYAPLTNFPPFYPAVLSLFERFNIDARSGARILNALLFGLTSILVGITLKIETNSRVFSLLGAFLIIASSTLVFFYSFALAEGLYIFLTSLGFLFLILYIKQNDVWYLILAGITAGLSIITRYVGIANLVTGIFILLVYRKQSITRTLYDLVIFTTLSILPILIWNMREISYSVAVDESARPSGIRGFNFDKIFTQDFRYIYLTIFHTLYSWYLPEKLVLGFEREHSILAVLSFLAIISGLLIYGWKVKNDLIYGFRLIKNRFTVNTVYAFFFLIYFSLIIAITLFGRVVIIERVFIPVLLSTTIICSSLVWFLWNRENKYGRFLSGLITVYLIVFSLWTFIDEVPAIHAKGLGLGRKSFQNNSAMQLLKEIPPTTTVYSNYPWALYLHTGEIGYRLNKFEPEKYLPEDVIIAIFTYESIYNPDFAVKYAENLNLLEHDRHVTVYRYFP